MQTIEQQIVITTINHYLFSSLICFRVLLLPIAKEGFGRVIEFGRVT